MHKALSEKEKIEVQYGPGDYIIVAKPYGSKTEFAHEVNYLMEYGYKPLGGLCVVGGSLSAMMFQAMTKT